MSNIETLKIWLLMEDLDLWPQCALPQKKGASRAGHLWFFSSIASETFHHFLSIIFVPEAGCFSSLCPKKGAFRAGHLRFCIEDRLFFTKKIPQVPSWLYHACLLANFTFFPLFSAFLIWSPQFRAFSIN